MAIGLLYVCGWLFLIDNVLSGQWSIVCVGGFFSLTMFCLASGLLYVCVWLFHIDNVLSGQWSLICMCEWFFLIVNVWSSFQLMRNVHASPQSLFPCPRRLEV